MPFLLESLASPPLLGNEYAFDVRVAIAAQIQRLINVRRISYADDLSLLEMGSKNVVDINLNQAPPGLHH